MLFFCHRCIVNSLSKALRAWSQATALWGAPGKQVERRGNGTKTQLSHTQSTDSLARRSFYGYFRSLGCSASTESANTSKLRFHSIVAMKAMLTSLVGTQT